MATQLQVDKAEERLLQLSENDEEWSPKELRQEAMKELPFEVVSLAFWRLLNRGELVINDDRRIRRRPRRATAA